MYEHHFFTFFTFIHDVFYCTKVGKLNVAKFINLYGLYIFVLFKNPSMFQDH